MKRLLRSVLSDVTYAVLRGTDRHTQGLRILMYHRVTDAHPGNRLCVPVATFSQQMRRLRELGFDTVTFAQAVQWVQRRTTLPSMSIVITFDDGFEDNFLYAYPALARYGFTGCFFVPSAFIVSATQTAHRPEDRPMNWEQLRALIAHGHEVGAHSVSHQKLARIPVEDMIREVRDSKTMLEQGLARSVEFFCYPAGDYNALVKQTVQTSGYLGACTVEPGANYPGSDPLALTRTEISAFDSLWDVEKKLAGAYDWLHRLVQWTKR